MSRLYPKQDEAETKPMINRKWTEAGTIDKRSTNLSEPAFAKASVGGLTLEAELS